DASVASKRGKVVKIRRCLMPVVKNIVNDFLDDNSRCEAFINNLLNQLAKDSNTTLTGDIRDYVDQFAASGTLFAYAVTSTNGGNIRPGGSASPARLGHGYVMTVGVT